MCIGVPVKIIEAGEFMSICQGRNGKEQINMMLIGSQPVGTWVLSFLGSARQVLSETEAAHINQALDGMAAIMSGETDINIDDYFPGMEMTL